MKLTEKIAYMRGMLDGMELDDSTKERKAIRCMSEVMEEMAVYIEDLQSQVDELTELADLLDRDLGEVESDLYGDDDDEEDDDDDDDSDEDEDFSIGDVLPADYDDFNFDDEDSGDEQYVVSCPSCEETVTLTERELEEGSMVCPFCGELLEFNYDDIESAADDEEAADDGDAGDGEAQEEDGE